MGTQNMKVYKYTIPSNRKVKKNFVRELVKNIQTRSLLFKYVEKKQTLPETKRR